MERISIAIIFVIVVLMAALLIAIGLAEPVVNSGGLAHPDVPGMQVGGDGGARIEHIAGYAFMFQVLLLALVVVLCVLSVSERNQSPQFFIAMGATLLLSWLVWWQMYSQHQNFLETGETAYFLGFPIATAWQTYGTWLAAIPLVLIYSFGFHRYIYTENDEARFNQLLAQLKLESESSNEPKETL
jgi:hypothetical protein